MELNYTITHNGLLEVLAGLAADSQVYVPYRKGERLFIDLFDLAKADRIDIGGVRSAEPIKSFLTHPLKELRRPQGDGRAVYLAGVKACDLSSLKIQDFVFNNGQTQDPYYLQRRQNLMILSADCTCALETCFCLAIDGRPFPDRFFDLNFSGAGDHYAVEVGSEKGRTVVSRYSGLFSSSDRAVLEQKESQRKRVTAEVEAFIKKRGTPAARDIEGAVMKNYDSQIWKDFYATCVECGACNLACPTCHCFLLFDKMRGGRPARFMEWDACLYSRFARVAGGANPRKNLWERLRNRFEKKFDFFPKVSGHTACTGCGRCIEACPGDIDIREVLKGLVNGKWNRPPND